MMPLTISDDAASVRLAADNARLPLATSALPDTIAPPAALTLRSCPAVRLAPLTCSESAAVLVVEIETFGIAEETIEKLRNAPGVASISIEERDQAQVLLVQSAKGLELTQTLLAMLEGTTVGRVAAREPTLEDAYVALVDTAA